MRRTLVALLVAIGIFVAVEAILFVIGVVVLQQGSNLDPNGITSTRSLGSERLSVTITNYGSLAALVLATVGGIVYGVRQPK